MVIEPRGDGDALLRDLLLRKIMATMRMVVIIGRVEGEVGPLDAQGAGEGDAGEELARPPRGEPAVDPREDHAGEEDVRRCEDGQRKQSEEPERGDCDADADS